MNEKILITGGTGYIGSHTAISLIERGYQVVILDNLKNSSEDVLDRIAAICGDRPQLIIGDIRDNDVLTSIFKAQRFDGVMHFAGAKAVGESAEQPLLYYENNVTGTLNLCKAMHEAQIRKLIFSSSATVYGDQNPMPLTESSPLLPPSSPYGRSKLMCEEILRDLHVSDNSWKIGILRYFNPIGAHSSGLIGESPIGTPNNLLPYILQVASGKRRELSVFGDNYPTPDGTGIRDYIHIMDLAAGHIRAYEYISDNSGARSWNLGSGHGYSVLQIINEFKRATGVNINYRIAPKRDGDVAECWAEVERAALELNWRPSRSLEEMLKDAWNWERSSSGNIIKPDLILSPALSAF